MLKKCLLLILVFTLSGILTAGEKPTVKDFVEPPKYRNIKISPDGKHFAASILRNEKQVIAVIRRKDLEILSVMGFKGKRQPGSVKWLNNERIGATVYYKSGALEKPFNTGNFFAMNIDGSKKKLIFGYDSKGGVKINPVVEFMNVLDYMRDDPAHILISAWPANKDSSNRTKAYKLNIYTGKKRKISSSPVINSRLLADNNAVVRFATAEVAEGGKNYTVIYYRKNTKSDWQMLNKFPDNGEGMEPLMFTKDNSQVYVYSSLSENGLDTRGLFLFDLKSKEMIQVYRHPRVDINGFNASRGNIYAVHVEPDYSQVITLDQQHPVGRWYPSLQKSFKYSDIYITSRTTDMEEVILRVSSEKDPYTFYLFNTKTSKLKELFSSAPWLKGKELATTEAFSVKADDGLDLYGYITLPNGVSKNLPMIVIPHGGPHGPRDSWLYDPETQFLASQGYAVLKVNFRGSGGYGVDFMKKGYGEWGGKMIDDITSATRWAIKEGIADENRICISGASYGGYATLMSVIKEQNLYQCAVGYVGVYDLEMMYEEGDIPERRTGINYLSKVIGEDKPRLKEFSPVTHVNKIKAELFIVHGEDDERVPIEQAEKLKKELDKIGKSYQWLVKEGEGHGFYKYENRLELYQKKLAFFNKNTKPL